MPRVTARSLWPIACMSIVLTGCAPTYYVVRSTPTLEDPGAPPVAIDPPQPVADLTRLALLPWEACSTGTTAERDACAAALDTLEQALLLRGFKIVAWQALREQMARRDETATEAAHALNVTHLVRVRAPVLGHITRQVRFRRSYYASDVSGAVGARTTLLARDADRLDVIAGRAEAEASFVEAAVLSVQLSLETASGEVVRILRESAAEPARRPHPITLLVRCEQGTCRPARHGEAESRRPPRATSERLLVAATAPTPLLEQVAARLAAQLAGPFSSRSGGTQGRPMCAYMAAR